MGVLVIGLAASVFAGGVNIVFMPMKSHPYASGTAQMGDQTFSLTARGLKANAVYTVWFVNMKPTKKVAGVGKAPYMFKTDAQGTGKYRTQLSTSPFGKWRKIMVVLHPDGDPKNMKKMVGALSAEIPK